MYAAMISTNSLTSNFYIPCGTAYWVKLDGRLNLSNLIQEAKDYFEKNTDFKGVAIFNSIKDTTPIAVRGFGEGVPHEPPLSES